MVSDPMMTPGDRAIYRKLKSPAKIQDYLDEQIVYNKAPFTCFGPHLVIEQKAAHCMEGALFGAAALRLIGFEPLVVDLTAVRDDDHVLAVFRVNGCWGAVAKSNYAGLRFRNPVYRTIRELAMSYFEHYFNPKGEKTMRGYSKPVNLSRFDGLKWMSTSEELWPVPMYLCGLAHSPVLPPANGTTHRYWMDKRLFDAGRSGMKE
ncbi:MAG TPA: hypothetical protein VGL53_04565 [Bryobacteraceae bacterium]|jgi:hypothetical protein